MIGVWFITLVLVAVIASVVLDLGIWPAVGLGLVAGLAGTMIDEARKDG